MTSFMNVRRTKYGIIGLLIILWICSLIYYLKVKPINKVDQSQKPTIDVQKIIPTGVEVSDGYIGRVEAINHVQIVPYISGYIADIIVSGGQKVEKGETLAFLRQEEYAAALTAAQAQLFSAKADFLNAKIKHERMQKAGSKAVSQQQTDDARAAYLVAEGNLEKAKADMILAQVNLDYTVLKAPFTGVIGNIDSSVGDFVSPQTASMMQIIQYNPIRVVFSVSDQEYPKLADLLFNKKSAKIRVQLTDGRILPDEGRNIYTANEIDDKTNSVAVYAEFDNHDHLLFPNAYVKVLVQKNYYDVLLVEKSLVSLKQDGYYLYVVENNEIKLHKLLILDEKDNSYVVSNNFAAETLLPTEVLSSDMIGVKVRTHLQNGDV